MIRAFAIPIILIWIAVIAVVNVVVPQLETVGQMRAVSMSPDSAPSMIAMKRVGQVFEEFNSDSSAMIVLEGDKPLGEDTRAFYGEMIRKLEADKKHVQSVQDFWSDPLTASGAQSNDGKAAYVQVYLAGNQGEALANESVEAVQTLVDGMKPPPGVKVFVTGPAALAADQHIAGDRSMQMIELVTFTVIIVMLLLVYRSIVTVLLTLVMVVLQLAAARGLVAFLGYHEIIGLSTFATNLLVTLAIAAGTDYAIFLIGRYQEARAVRRRPRTGLLHHVPRDGPRGAGLRSHHRRRDLLPELHQAAVLPVARCAAGDRHDGRRSGRADAQRRDHHRREPVRQLARAQARAEGARLAQDRRRRRPLARSDPGGDDRSFADRPVDAARLPHQLQRPQLSARRPACKRGLRRGRPALLASADEPRAADDRERPRSAQLRRLPRHRQDRQIGVPGSGYLAGPGHHPARRQADRAHVDPVPDQHAGHHPADESEVSAGPHGGHARAGRRDEQDDRDHDEDVRTHQGDGGNHALDGHQDEGR